MNPRDIKRLIASALSAQKSAYCPYSRYAVGASVLTTTGRIFSGCNVENASYGLTVCAERIAIFNAITRNQRSLRAVCIVATGAKPCGACRQVMFEFSTKDTALFLVNIDPTTHKQSVTKTTVFKMLPSAFDPLASGILPANPQNLLRRSPGYAGRPAARRRRRSKSRPGGRKSREARGPRRKTKAPRSAAAIRGKRRPAKRSKRR